MPLCRRISSQFAAREFRATAPRPPMVKRVYHDGHGHVFGETAPTDPAGLPRGILAGDAVWTRQGWLLIAEGEWIVTSVDGEHRVFRASAFAREFELVEG